MIDFTMHAHDTSHDILADMEYIDDPRCVLYLGACCGYEAGLIANKYTMATVHAVEACEETFRNFLDKNRPCAGNRVITALAAIGESSSKSTFYIAKSNTQHSLLRQLDNGGPVAERTVSVISIKDYCENSGGIKPDVLILDLEGIALRALRGAGELLSAVRLIAVETEPAGANVFVGGDTHEDVAYFLAHSGFKMVRLWLPTPPVRQLNSTWLRMSN